MEYLADILQYFKNHPEVTWSGAGLTALAVLSWPVAKLFGLLFRKAEGRNTAANKMQVTQTVTGNNNIVAGAGDVKVERQ
ncbi:MAG: hypothetical protein D3918_12260 [Candidatus Electrothrix sp. AX2]|nr:hypothetical protein [Candidatus Electrothrix gigas]